MTGGKSKGRVFVSYSRSDIVFADQLVLALEDKGFEPVIDRHDIDPGERWKDRLGKLILECDQIVFVLTEASARSAICAWEVDEAQRLGKRIVPALPAPLQGTAPPESLAELNYILFYPDPKLPQSGFYHGVKQLVRFLSEDTEWLRDATRYQQLAVEWEGAGRSEDLLLRGAALDAAEAWLTGAPQGAQIPRLVRHSWPRARRRKHGAKPSQEARSRSGSASSGS